MPEHIYTIYRITCLVNWKLYHGFTSKDPVERWKEHEKFSENRKYLIQKAINKYGIENFTFKIIYQSTDKNHCLKEMEEYFIRKYKSHVSEGGYNLTYGGEGLLGYIPSEESKMKQSASMKGKPAWNKGIKTGPVSEETRKKMSLSMEGKSKSFRTEEHKRNISISKIGTKHTEETKRKISQNRKGKGLKIIPPQS